MIEHEATMYHILKKYGLYNRREDYIDICYIGYTKALNSFDDTKGKLHSYIYKCIENALINELRKENMQKRKCDEVSLDFIYDEFGHDFGDLIADDIDIEQDLIKQEEKQTLDTAILCLTKTEQYIIKNLFKIDGYCLTTGELASKFKTNLNAILKIKNTSLEKLKEILDER